MSFLIGVIVLSNMTPVRVFFEGAVVNYCFETKNSEFEFVVTPSKGRGVDMMERSFSSFLIDNPQTGDKIIYRTFTRNPIKFWNWYFYMTSDLYEYDLKATNHNNGYKQ